MTYDYNDFSDLDVKDPDAMTARMEKTEEDLDSVTISSAILIVCDYLDINAVEVLKCLIPGNPPPDNISRAESRLIRDLIETSQSHYDKSLHALLEVLTLDEMIGNLA